MSAKRGRGAKAQKETQHENKRSSGKGDGSGLSALNADSFMEGLQKDSGNPLHSTAVEEDLRVSEEQQNEQSKKEKTKGGTKGVQKTPVNRQRAAGKRQTKQTGSEDEMTEKKKKKKINKEEVTKARPKKKELAKTDKESERESETLSQGDSEPVAPGNKPRKVLNSDDEDVTDEDTSWKPSPKKGRMSRKFLLETRRSLPGSSPSSPKSSQGSSSEEAEQINTEPQKKKKKKKDVRQRGGTTQLDVVLEAFLEFCDQYSESVESGAVRRSINCFSSNVEEQLLEKISSQKELKVLKRKNAKVASAIRTKTKRLLDAKHEQMKAHRQLYLLQKETDELKQRLDDLRRSQAFLSGLRGLHTQYLEHRHTHPKEKETYGASSLPALLLEVKHVQTAELQLRAINNRLEERLTVDQASN